MDIKNLQCRHPLSEVHGYSTAPPIHAKSFGCQVSHATKKGNYVLPEPCHRAQSVSQLSGILLNATLSTQQTVQLGRAQEFLSFTAPASLGRYLQKTKTATTIPNFAYHKVQRLLLPSQRSHDIQPGEFSNWRILVPRYPVTTTQTTLNLLHCSKLAMATICPVSSYISNAKRALA